MTIKDAIVINRYSSPACEYAEAGDFRALLNPLPLTGSPVTGWNDMMPALLTLPSLFKNPHIPRLGFEPRINTAT